MEIWKSIPTFKDYQVSNLGNIKSLARDTKNQHCKIDKILKGSPNTKGYLQVNLFKDKKQFPVRIHRLVAIMFVDNPKNKMCVNHKNGIKTDNTATNLEWCTNRENVIHAVENNLFKPPQMKGEKHGRSKLKDVDILNIRQNKKSRSEMSKEYNVTLTTISNILDHKTWRHIK